MKPEFSVDAANWNAAISDMQRRLPGVARDRILRNEIRLVAQKLVRHEYRAKGQKIGQDLRSRLVLLWDSGNEYNVPREDAARFRRMPKGAQRRYRERKKGGRLIEPKEIGDYTRRAGYLASGWGAGARHFGVSLPVYASRHNLSKSGSVQDNLNIKSEPHAILTNKAGPTRGSEQKLNMTLRIQARNMQRVMEKEINILFNRVYPKQK